MIFKILNKDKIKLHFIHIGKTGGSNLKNTLKEIKLKKYELILHPHEIALSDIPIGEKIIFCSRNPIERFQSGFYSRQRKGQPRYYSEWSDSEAIAFENFSTPDELASSLNESNIDYNKAMQAMKTIEHVKSSYWDWFQSEEYFIERLPDIFFVLKVEKLNDDFKKLTFKMGLKENLNLGIDKLSMHSNGIKYYLSKKSLKNLNVWYKKENDFIQLLNKKIEKINK